MPARLSIRSFICIIIYKMQFVTSFSHDIINSRNFEIFPSKLQNTTVINKNKIIVLIN